MYLASRIVAEQLQMEAVQLSYTRLRESPCRWRRCGAFLSCTMKLIQHVVQHAQKNHAVCVLMLNRAVVG